MFIYGDISRSARNIRQAIYDGPYDLVNFDLSPVILLEKPSLENRAALIEPVTVQVGNLIVTSDGKIASLGEGVLYRPAGCSQPGCALIYSGAALVQLDQLVVRFRLREGLAWSDGTPLTADDSIYSFEVASNLYPMARPDLIAHTASYNALDAVTIEWRGLPGYMDAAFAGNFFTPLPRHAWGNILPQDLLSNQSVTRTPLGWGPYIIEEWIAGDHLTLKKNPGYFRSGEGLPSFDSLVFRFVPDPDQALNALLAGECDILDETIGLEAQSARLLELQSKGQLKAAFQTGAAWEHLEFGIQPYVSAGSEPPVALFEMKETRQAVALCLDRQKLVDELMLGQSVVPDSYILPNHPFYNDQVRQYPYDPQAANALLDAVGWLDQDGDSLTPRLSQAVPGVPDGAPFQVDFLTTDEAEKLRAAEIIQASLAQCGIQVNIQSNPWETFYASGPEGALFGRHFSLAQFAWEAALQPPCYLYTTSEIPGPYPEFPKGWGGANASGYSNPEYDRLCEQASTVLSGGAGQIEAHHQAQALFAEDLPALPLYFRLKVAVMRPALCGLGLDSFSDSALWNLESYSFGADCP
ncbi:MAG: peptide ABC transporter substrate-binding protein [Anaerolineales bacterium]|nr:peptide ABC transporter substrate-binding protein [Anaerolineales bacterium]